MVIIGYGNYRNYRIQQIPDAFLSELVERYQLSHDAQARSEYDDLQLTIAIHEEVQRRKSGGPIRPKEPTARELAKRLVAKGYQSLSKDHHPDRGGSENAQKMLNGVRDQLLAACGEIDDDCPEGALIVPQPAVRRASTPISDEDIPF
jgi:hypothetical protein